MTYYVDCFEMDSLAVRPQVVRMRGGRSLFSRWHLPPLPRPVKTQNTWGGEGCLSFNSPCGTDSRR